MTVTPTADSYTLAVNSGMTKTAAKKLGLPRPALLRRYHPGDPLTTGPVLIVSDPASRAAADAVAAQLLDWGVRVERHGGTLATGQHWGGIVLVLTDAPRPAAVAETLLALPAEVKKLAPSARFVTISRAVEAADAPELAAVRQGVAGFIRSLAKELRNGATGNGIVLTGGADAGDPSVLAALRFFLSAKSAYVDGQLLEVGVSGGFDRLNHPESQGASERSATAAGGAHNTATAAGGAENTATGSTARGPATAAGGAENTATGSSASIDDFDWEKPLAGKVAVVTGAARGIGASIAKTLARDGATVVCVDVPAAGEALANTANTVHGTALQLDVTAPDAGAKMLAHARERHGGLDIVVHNAGITRDKLFANMRDDKWDPVVAVNIESQLNINEALLAAAKAGEIAPPRIVSLASTSGIAGNRGQTNYAFTKAGVVGQTAATGALLAPLGGTANAVAPGFIETEMTGHIPFATRQVARRLSSLLQGGQPVDVAEAIAFLVSPLASGVNGQTLRVCGQNLVGR